MKATFNKHRYRNFFIGFAISCGLTLFAFNYKTDYNIGEIVEVMPDNDTYGVQVVSVKFPKKQIIKEKPRPKKTQPFTVNAKLKLVKHDIVVPTALKPAQPAAIPVSTPPVGPVTQTTSKVIMGVDVKPSFPGGMEALNRYLRNNLRYPGDCEEFEKQGTVKVMFIVDEKGRITDIKIIGNELLPSAGEESKRVIKGMPIWTPGMKDGRPVKTYFIQPIRFRLF